MKVLPYYILLAIWLSPQLIQAQNKNSNSENNTPKKMDNRVTLWRNDKAPYGTYYAYQQLSAVFKEAEIIIDKQSPREKNVFGKSTKEELDKKISLHQGKIAQVIITPQLVPDESELEALMSFVYDGNQLFVSTFYVGELLLKKLDLATFHTEGGADFGDSLWVDVINPVSSTKEAYTYPGKRYDNSFSTYNSNNVSILGRNKYGEPNFIKIKYTGGGSIYLHLAPLAFSNFFLLHKNNKTYYDQVLSYLPSDTKLITWGEYFRTKEESNSTGRAFSFMMKHKSLAAALWLLLLLFALIFLFESKRKQRLVAIRPPLKNTSLDFVKTIGRLYFQRHDNKNLAAKMTAHFLDHVRTKYNVPTSRMDENFEKKLAYKTGIEYKVVHDVVYQANYLNDQPSISDADLLYFNHQLQNFYKKA